MPRTTVETQISKIRIQMEALQAKEKVLLSKANDKVIAQIISLAKKHKITSDEILSAMGSKTKTTAKPKSVRTVKQASDKRAKVLPKYRDPADANNTWTGRGRPPKVFQALKDSGLLDSALIIAE